MLHINIRYNDYRKENFDKVFQTEVMNYSTEQLGNQDANFDMPLRRSMYNDKDSKYYRERIKYSADRTKRNPTYTRTRTSNADPDVINVLRTVARKLLDGRAPE